MQFYLFIYNIKMKPLQLNHNIIREFIIHVGLVSLKTICKRIMYYDFKDLIIKTNNIPISISLGFHYFNENNFKTVKQQSL
jgi:hypothetical protein